MDTCEICGFKSNFSGIIRHRKKRHDVFRINSVITSSESEYSEIDSLRDSFEPSGVVESKSIGRNILSSVEPRVESKSSIENNVPGAADLQTYLFQPNRCINNFFLQCQLQQLMSLGTTTPSTRDEERIDAEASYRVCTEFGKLVSELGISTKGTDSLLRFIRRRDLNMQLLPRTWRTLQMEINSNFDRHSLQTAVESDVYGDGEETIEFDVSDVNALAPKVYLVKRKNVLTAAIKLLLDKYLCTPGALVLSARATTAGSEKVYGEVHTGGWWDTLCKEHVAPGCHPLVVNIFTDGTRVGRNTSRQPFVLSITNYGGRVQRSIAGKTILGYIPYVKGHEAGAGKLAEARARLAREVYRVMTKDLIHGNQEIFPLVIHGKILHFQIFVQNVILDGPEARKATGVLSACPTCYTPREKFDADTDQLTESERSWRTTAAMKEVITECDQLRAAQVHSRDGTAPAIKAILDKVNVRHVENPWWEVPFASPYGIYGAVAIDRMHLLQGLINNLQLAMDQVIKSECNNLTNDEASRNAYLTRVHCVMDDRFACIPQFLTLNVYLPRFSTGFYSKSLVEAWHDTAWLSLIPFVLGDDHPAAIVKTRTWRYNRISILCIVMHPRERLLNNAILLMAVVYPMWVSTEMTEGDVQKLEASISAWRSHFREHFSQFLPKKNCQHEKFHRILHVPDLIRLYGVPGNHCTSTWEQAHVVMAKEPAEHSNRKNVPLPLVDRKFDIDRCLSFKCCVMLAKRNILSEDTRLIPHLHKQCSKNFFCQRQWILPLAVQVRLVRSKKGSVMASPALVRQVLLQQVRTLVLFDGWKPIWVAPQEPDFNHLQHCTSVVRR